MVLSIQAGLVLPLMLLRKLSSYNRKNLLYRAFREIGRVERTLFLLRFIADTRSGGPSAPKPPRSSPSTTSSTGSRSVARSSRAATPWSRRSSSNTPPSLQTRSCYQTFQI